LELIVFLLYDSWKFNLRGMGFAPPRSAKNGVSSLITMSYAKSIQSGTILMSACVSCLFFRHLTHFQGYTGGANPIPRFNFLMLDLFGNTPIVIPAYARIMVSEQAYETKHLYQNLTIPSKLSLPTNLASYIATAERIPAASTYFSFEACN